MHSNNEMLGTILKEAREKAEITVEELAERTGISERYLYRIENEGKKPSFNVLYKLIRELSIAPDLIFYPERPSAQAEMENLIRMIYSCDERSFQIVRATVVAALKSQLKK